jgi:hypothetical protein
MPRDANVVLTCPGRGLAAALLLIAVWVLPTLAQEAGAVKRFDISLENGRVTGGLEVLQTIQGDQVDILWTSDRVVTLHLHGYDLEITVAPGSSQSMTFTARATGRYPVEIHGGAGRRRTLMYVEVHPH